jgi:cell wall-associated NlpC family hydrolase
MSYLILNREEQLKLQGLAARMKGIPYKYGAEVTDLSVEPENIKKIDCSETIEYIYRKIGYRAPDGAANQHDVSGEVLQPEIGDLAFKKNKAGVVIHVAMIISTAGKQVMVVEAAGSLGKVVIRPLDEFKVKPSGPIYAGIRRFIAEKVKRVV